MNSKHLFDSTTIAELQGRIQTLKTDQEPLWGQMNVAQMLAHCCEVLNNALGKGQQKRRWIGYLVAPFIRHRYYDHIPFQQKGVRSTFTVSGQRNFAEERQLLLDGIQYFYQHGKEQSRYAVHPMLGRFTPEQWAIGQYKHLDHHLRQFGV